MLAPWILAVLFAAGIAALIAMVFLWGCVTIGISIDDFLRHHDRHLLHHT